MLKHQYLRGILVANNLVSLIISFIVSTQKSHDSYGRQVKTIFQGMGTFLLLSWLQNLVVLLYTTRKVTEKQTAGYFRITSHDDELVDLDNLESNGRRMGPVMATVTFVLDVGFTIGFLTFVILGFCASKIQADGIATIGAVVATVVHLFFALAAFDLESIRRYKIKVIVVRRDHEFNLANEPATSAKEQQSFEESSAIEPENIPASPYRGSPLTKPSKGNQSPRQGYIKLSDATEGDALISDHD